MKKLFFVIKNNAAIRLAMAIICVVAVGGVAYEANAINNKTTDIASEGQHPSSISTGAPSNSPTSTAQGTNLTITPTTGSQPSVPVSAASKPQPATPAPQFVPGPKPTSLPELPMPSLTPYQMPDYTQANQDLAAQEQAAAAQNAKYQACLDAYNAELAPLNQQLAYLKGQVVAVQLPPYNPSNPIYPQWISSENPWTATQLANWVSNQLVQLQSQINQVNSQISAVKAKYNCKL